LRCRVEDHVRAGYAGLGWDFARPLDADKRCLSPSDFGLHNALRRPDGRFAFVDFEYFGWDDPVKLVADFILHPGMTLPSSLIARFRRGARRLFASDPDFAQRLALLEPLIALRWGLILLNEFLAEGWQARAFAGTALSQSEAKARQLAKARARTLALSKEPLR
jgi:hypothetical protein